jgi:hypothetical protein
MLYKLTTHLSSLYQRSDALGTVIGLVDERGLFGAEPAAADPAPEPGRGLDDLQFGFHPSLLYHFLSCRESHSCPPRTRRSLFQYGDLQEGHTFGSRLKFRRVHLWPQRKHLRKGEFSMFKPSHEA